METDCLRMHIKSPIQQSMDISINSMRPLFLGSEHLKPNRLIVFRIKLSVYVLIDSSFLY